MSHILSREIPLVPAQSALLFIDVQNFGAHRRGGEFDGLSVAEIDARFGYYFSQLETVALPNMQRLQAAFRNAKMEVLYTTIESLTKDGRDRSLDYKISGFNVAEPRISVSSRPRARSIRSVKTWPRSGSLPSWASSIAAKAKSLGRSPRCGSRGFGTGMLSAVHST